MNRKKELTFFVALSLIAGTIISLLGQDFVLQFTSVGLSVKETLLYSLGVTFVILVTLAVISEGGLLGELQYLVSSFLVYFFVSFLIIGYVW